MAIDYALLVESVREQHAALVRERAYASCADPRLRPIQATVIDMVADGIMASRKPAAIARQLHRKFPHVNVAWAAWVGDEIVIAIARLNLVSFDKMMLARYDWLAAPDCCGRCRALQDGGPYPVGAGPLPVLDSHSGCTCTLAGCAD